MKFGFHEEDDITDLYRKMAKEGAQWGCNWLNGFLESLNAKREPDGRYTVLVRTPGECDFCDFVFAVGNRICAVVFNVYSWGQCLLTYERRKKLMESSLEHHLMPIVVNLLGGWKMDNPETRFECGFQVAENRWMTDPVSDVTVFPEMGLAEDGSVKYKLDEWAAELYAKKAAREVLEHKGFKVVQVYPNNRFLWATDRADNPTWILVSFHHAAMKMKADYSFFDKNGTEVAGKAGYGVDIGFLNGKDAEQVKLGRITPVFRSPDVVAEVVSMTKLAKAEE